MGEQYDNIILCKFFKSFKKIKEGCTSLSKPSIALTRSHSEDASFGVLDGSVERDCHAEA